MLFGLNYGINSVDGEHYRNLAGRPNGLKTFIQNDASTLEAFAMDRWQVADRTTLVFALQSVSADRNVLNVDASSGTRRNPNSRHSSANPRLGLLRDIGSGTTLFANVSRLYEPPTNFQLEDNVAGGDATLDAMHGSVFEVGFRGGSDLSGGGNWAWDVTVYQAEIRNEILSVEDPAAPGTSLVTNIDETHHSGIEGVFSASFRLGASSGRSLDTLLSVTVNDFAFVNDSEYGSNDLPAAPDYFARGEILYRGRNGMYAGPVLDFVGERFADFANSYRIPAYTLLGLRVGWSNERWQAFVELHNLDDEIYIVSHSVRDKAGPGDAILNAGEPLSGYVGFRVRVE